MNEKEALLYLDFAKSMAYQAGEVMKQYYYGNQQIEIKNDNSPVTIADTAINSLLIKKVQELFPKTGVLGEEESWNSDCDELWVCDPIDGTKAYILKIPVAMFSLAFVRNGEPLVAVAYNPWTDQLYEATKGGGAKRNNEVIAVSKRAWNTGVQLLGSSHPGPSGEPVDSIEVWGLLQQNNTSVTNVPGSVFKGCLVAEGSADGRTFMHNGAHDIAAIKLIIEEAGGKVTDLQGNEQRYDRAINGAIMSNGMIHNELLQLVRQRANTRH